MGEQKVYTASQNYRALDQYIIENRIKRILLVCDSSVIYLGINEYFHSLPERIGIEIVRFSNFCPNPLYESVVEGVNLFHKENCDAIFAVGGGSAMDVAKCIKLFCNMNDSVHYLKQEIVPNDIFFLAIPTTAGTGSEATRYAVIYFEGAKQSITDDSCIPSFVLLDSSVLKTLPVYQKKSTMLDALCHAMESFWSVNSTKESKKYSRTAIQMIITYMNGYIANEEDANAAMLKAANIAGKAINITQTTAGHAMCYKITSLYGVAHGHAAGLCNRVLFPWMIKHTDRCIDPRGEGYLKKVFREIAEIMDCDSAEEAADEFQRIFASLDLRIPEAREEDYEVLKRSVNPVRLKNHPVQLDELTLDMLYHEILK